VISASAKANPRLRDLHRLMTPSKEAVADATEDADKVFRRIERTLFSSQGKSGGKPWPALSTRYAKWKARRFPGRKILTLRGDLRRSLTDKGGEHLAHSFRGPRGWVIRLGTSHWKAPLHAMGAGNLPVRRPIQLTGADREALAGAVSRAFIPHVQRAVRAMAAGAR